ncbi:type IV secretion system DNA-binding domain-containing protein [Halostagnicola kamekurae]|uniref:Type IV secretion-system coupling protein DNA-binding domain-containing protein n=1 Tax=Halostagnicola kamekurae TaxID=619731 RepID=A0A1I6V895_9EURY|nr:type IV secretion system DNA-binding domain-containing protein [Halostagnicola kamekurae]SFT09872.1 Type IV secretion-system coupling protein DNA-binding domain-containing protein [Halostagnicola kamekurae]
MSLKKHFQYYVRPAWFVLGWILFLLIWLFYLPTPVFPIISLSIWELAFLASPFLFYWYWKERPPQLTLSSQRLDDSEVGLPVNHINETDHLDGRLLRRMIPIDLTGSIGILGATRSGKTNATKLLVDQIREKTDEQTPVIIYDHKTDFQDHLAEDEHIVLSGQEADVQWNIFEEVESDQDCEELARELFPTTSDGTDFFNDASRQLFAAVLQVMRREAPSGTTPTNEDLVTWIESTTVEELAETLSKHPDLQGITDYIDPDASEQAQGVMASFRKELRNMFQGDLCESGSWSIRQYMDDPQGQVLIIDYPQRLGESTKPLIRFTIDWAIRFALDDGDQSAYFVLDEFARLPPLRRIGDLVNVGAGQDTRALITLQSVAQLYDQYGQDGGNALLSGLLSTIILRLNDSSSIAFARSRVGTYWEEQDTPEYNADGEISGTSIEYVEKHAMAKGEFGDFAPGWGIIVRNDGWVDAQIDLYDDVAEYITDTGPTTAGEEVDSIGERCPYCGEIVTGTECTNSDCTSREMVVK